MFAPARHLDPLRIVQGSCGARYDCPDVATVDGHLVRLSRRVATSGVESPDVELCRTDIDRLLDRRAWLTLPVAPRGFRLRMVG
jgi:endonuclease III